MNRIPIREATLTVLPSCLLQCNPSPVPAIRRPSFPGRQAPSRGRNTPLRRPRSSRSSGATLQATRPLSSTAKGVENLPSVYAVPCFFREISPGAFPQRTPRAFFRQEPPETATAPAGLSVGCRCGRQGHTPTLVEGAKTGEKEISTITRPAVRGPFSCGCEEPAGPSGSSILRGIPSFFSSVCCGAETSVSR